MKLGANSSIYRNYFYDSVAFCWISFASCACKVQCSVHLLRVFCENPRQLCIFSVYLFLFIYLFIAFYWAGFTVAQRERGQEDFNVPYEGAPPHPPSICIRKTATAPGSPYSFRIVRGFFYVPQNYQHSRNCETRPPAYRPYPRRLESLTICR